MNIFDTVVEYLRSAKSELQKVSWPSRQDTIRYSSLVLGVSLIVAAFFASLDYGLNALTDAALQSRLQSSAVTQTQPDASQPSVTVTPNTQPTPSTSTPGLNLNGSNGNLLPTTPTTNAPTKK